MTDQTSGVCPRVLSPDANVENIYVKNAKMYIKQLCLLNPYILRLVV